MKRLLEESGAASAGAVALLRLRPSVWAAIGLFSIQAALVGAHLLAYDAAGSATDPELTRAAWDFNQEGSFQTWWSGLVMFGAGLTVFYSGFVQGLRGSRLVPWLLLGAGFVWIGAEEALLQLHEESQMASDVDWPVLYAPAIAIAVWVILRVRKDLRPPLDGLMLLALACLVAAVGAEALSSPRIAIDFDLRNLVEENLELAGATLVLVTALAARPGDGPRDA